VVGGIALFVGAIFFLSLAFSRGWIGPEARVALGVVAGLVTGTAGAALLLRSASPIDARREVLAHVLLGLGLGVVNLALFAATRLYGLLAPEVALAIVLAVGVGTAALAIRQSSE